MSKFIVAHLILILIFLTGCDSSFRAIKTTLSSSNQQGFNDDSVGIEAFNATVYTITRSDCASCHASVQSPHFASPSVEVAFRAALTKVNFDAIETSTLVIRADNGHCGLPACTGQKQRMIDAISAWKARWKAKDQGPVIQFDLASAMVKEAAGTVEIPFTASFASSAPLTLAFNVGGTATNPADHTLAAASTVTLPALQSKGKISVALKNNTTYQDNRTLILGFAAGPDYAVGATGIYTLTIEDDDPMPSVQFAVASQMVLENAGAASIQVSLSAPSGKAVQVPYTVAGTASSADHNLVNGMLTIPAGQASGMINLNVVNDTIFEGDETILVNLGTPTGATLGTTVSHTLTIRDDDTPPALQFRAATQMANEGTMVTVSVDLVGATALPATVAYQVAGTATAGVDHNLAAGNLTFAVGTATQNISFQLTADTLVENDETVLITLLNPMNAQLGAISTHTVTIKDASPAPTVQFSVASQLVSETAGQAPVTLVLSNPTAKDVTVPIALSGTATNGSDYTYTAGNVVITAGTTSKMLTVGVIADGVFEQNETVIMTLGAPTNANLGAVTMHTLTLTDGMGAPTLQWSAASQTVSESQATVSITAALSAPSATAVTVPYTVSGTATGGGVDHNLANGTLTVAANSTSQTLTFNLINDTISEPNETVIVTLGTPSGANLGANAIHTVTITDNETPPVVQFQVATASVLESAGTASFTVTANPMASRDIMIPYTVSGTSSNPADHNLSSGTIVISALTASKSVTFNIADDTIFEGNETVVVALGTPSLGTLGTNNPFTLTIQDNEVAPKIQFSTASQTLMENAGTASVLVTLDKASTVPVTVTINASGTAVVNSDFTLPSTTLTIPAQSTQAVLSLGIVDDTIHEPTESVTLTLSNPNNATLGTQTTHAVTINDNDPVPTVSWSMAMQAVSEGVGTATATLVLDKASGEAATVNYTVSGTATAGADYTLSSGAITIPVGSTSAVVNIPIINDTTPEPDDERIVLTISSATLASVGSVNVITTTITDNDPTATVAMEAFRYSVYKITRTNCVGCHGATQVPLHASADIPTAYVAAKSKTNFMNIADSILVTKIKDGHCGSAVCMTDGSAMVAAITQWAASEASMSTPTPTPSGGQVLFTADTRLKLGHRKFVASKLTQLFGTPAQNSVNNMVSNQPALFGGSCDLYGSAITNLPVTGQCSNRSDSQAPSLPIANSARLALTVRACDQILQSDTAVGNAAMTALGVTTSQTARVPADADIQALYGYFYRDRVAPTAVLTALKAVVTQTQTNAYPSIEAWRFLIFTLCSSPDWQIQ